MEIKTLNCKVSECENPVRIQKMGYCTKHEFRFRRNKDTAIKVRDKTKPVRIPNGAVIKERKRLENYYYVMSNITPKIQLGFIKNEYELKEEIYKLLDDVKKIDGSFRLVTNRYFDYVKDTCNSNLAIKHGLIPVDEIPFCYAISTIIPIDKEIALKDLVKKVQIFVTSNYLKEQLGSKFEKIEVKFNEFGYFYDRILYTINLEHDKIEEIKFHISQNFSLQDVVEVVKKILQIPDCGFVSDDFFVSFRDSEETIKNRVNAIIEEKDEATDDDLAQAGIHKKRFNEPEPNFPENYDGFVPEVISFILDNGPTPKEKIPTEFEGQKIPGIEQLVSESEGLLKINNNVVEFVMTEKYNKYLKLCKDTIGNRSIVNSDKGNFDDAIDTSIDDLISEICLNGFDVMSKEVQIMKILIEKYLTN